jgi:hypothetical protein
MRPLSFLSLLLALGGLCFAATPTSPKEHFGFNIGDDYHLANYTQTAAYFERLARESDRIRLVDMGHTEEGRTQWMVVISSPANLARLTHFQDISRRLARAEDLDEPEARRLAAEGRAVVWIDGGLHASETVGSHQLIETVWQLASAQDPETRRFLDDVIVLCAHANPDGQELVANWYMREPVPEKRTLTTTPRLYQKYIGHDNNRDFYLSSQRETTNINRQLYLEWFPQVVYNHHQTGPAGTVIFVPPFRDPFNYNYDPLIVVGVQTLGTAIQSRFLAEGKPGATSRSGANYSTWFNGSLRTTSYFHNMIGLLSEIIGNPTPIEIPFIARRQLPNGDLTAPVPPQTWHYRQSIEYSLSANRAVLDYASRQRDTLLLNAYRMGRNSIERGRRDSWTPRPSRLEEIQRLAAKDPASANADDNQDPDEPPSALNQRLAPKHYSLLRKPEWRDPRGFILPADQPDFPTAVQFVNALLKTGIRVHRASAEFSVNDRRYPAGSYVVRCDQAFRPHVLDMFEPQDHPNDLKYPGGPPNKPYDTAGYTLAYQMGVQFDRILTAFDGPLTPIPYGELQPAPAQPFTPPPQATGFLVSHQPNNAAILANRLLKAGVAPRWLRQSPKDVPNLGPGALFVPNVPATAPILADAARNLGLSIQPTQLPPDPADSLLLRPARIALWDRFGGSMPSGWTRWLLEQFEFPFQVVFSKEIDAGGLREKYDAIIFVTGAIPAPGGRTLMINRPRDLPAEFEGRTGRLTSEKSIAPLRAFLEAGGTVICIGSSTSLAYQLGLPLRNGLAEQGSGGRARPFSDDKFYIPGSVLEARFDPTLPLAWGMPGKADVFFERSAVFALETGADGRGVQRVAWYESEHPLRSGWGLGQSLLKDRIAIATAQVGEGKLHLMGSEVAFRAQTHGTFKLLFNALHLSTAEPATP